ncbi:MAG: hypothetical protein ACRCYQ_03990 [Nocardioides sp.]
MKFERAAAAAVFIVLAGVLTSCGGGDGSDGSQSADSGSQDHDSMNHSESDSPEPSSEPPSSEPPSSEPPSSEPAATGTVVDIRIADGEVSGVGDKVKLAAGDEVTLNVTSDIAEEVHVHGYDKFVDVEPGKPATLRFTADLPGVYEVEFEESGTLLFELEVR